MEVNGTRKGITCAFDAVIVLSWLKRSRGIKKHSFAIEAARRNAVFSKNTGDNSRGVQIFPVNSFPVDMYS